MRSANSKPLHTKHINQLFIQNTACIATIPWQSHWPCPQVCGHPSLDQMLDSIPQTILHSPSMQVVDLSSKHGQSETIQDTLSPDIHTWKTGCMPRCIRCCTVVAVTCVDRLWRTHSCTNRQEKLQDSYNHSLNRNIPLHMILQDQSLQSYSKKRFKH